MFENHLDTSLLRDAFISCGKFLDSIKPKRKRNFDVEDSKVVFASLCSTLNSLRAKEGNALCDKLRPLTLQNRCHAAVFFTILRSYGISCPEGNRYFESILHTFPTVELRLYLRLNLKYHWSEQFVQCSKQLPLRSLSILLDEILSVEWADDETDLKRYGIHLATQAVIQKTPDSDPESCVDAPEKGPLFNFPFDALKSSVETDSEDENDDAKRMDRTWETIDNCLDKCSKFESFEVILHGFKSIFRHLSQSLNSMFPDFYHLTGSLEALCEVESFVGMSSDLRSAAQSCYANRDLYDAVAWGVHMSYLLFVVCCSWDDFLESRSESQREDYFSELPSGKYKEKLASMNHWHAQSFREDNTGAAEFLRTLVLCAFPYFSRAAAIILQHPELREQDVYLTALEKQASNLVAADVYRPTIDSIIQAESKDAKSRLLNVFHEVLSGAPDVVFRKTLEYVLHKYGVIADLKLPSFDTKLAEFVWKTMSLHEAKSALLRLFVQSPAVTLNTILEQALIRGPEGMSIIKVLKHVPIVCVHEHCLVEALRHYFSKPDLAVHEAKNMVCLMQTVMSVHREVKIISIDLYLMECILPNLYVGSVRIQLILECLNESLESLTEVESTTASEVDGEIFRTLVMFVSSLIDSCIKSANGKVKQLAVRTISLLRKLDKDTRVASCSNAKNADLELELSSFDTMTRVYIWMYFSNKSYEEVVDSSSRVNACLVSWCCNTRNLELFLSCLSQENTSYAHLLNILVSLISHFTQEEWMGLSELLEEFFRHQKYADKAPDIPWLLPEGDRIRYYTIRCLMDCYFVGVKKSLADINYLTSCYTNTVMRLLGSSPRLLASTALETCHLMALSDVTPALASFLLAVRKAIPRGKAAAESTKVIIRAIECLPPSDEKAALLQKFQ